MKAINFALLFLVAFSNCAGAAEQVRLSVTNCNMSDLAAGAAAKKGFLKTMVGTRKLFG